MIREEITNLTLSELIRLCGDAFGFLERTGNQWSAPHRLKSPFTRYTTPEIAVAELYLWLQANDLEKLRDDQDKKFGIIKDNI